MSSLIVPLSIRRKQLCAGGRSDAVALFRIPVFNGLQLPWAAEPKYRTEEGAAEVKNQKDAQGLGQYRLL